MSDNLKTWPEKIYLGGPDGASFTDNVREDIGWSVNEYKNHVEYVRADIAKDREEKIINAAIAARLKPGVEVAEYIREAYKSVMLSMAGLRK